MTRLRYFPIYIVFSTIVVAGMLGTAVAQSNSNRPGQLRPGQIEPNEMRRRSSSGSGSVQRNRTNPRRVSGSGSVSRTKPRSVSGSSSRGRTDSNSNNSSNQ